MAKVPDVLRCEVCTRAAPNIVCLIPLKRGFGRALACGRSCVQAIHDKYLRHFLEASVRVAS